MAEEEAWFKSSYSGHDGTACVEVCWIKSSYSGDDGTNCVEVADLHPDVGVRDSKDKAGPALVFTGAAWASFLHEVGTGRFDL